MVPDWARTAAPPEAVLRVPSRPRRLRPTTNELRLRATRRAPRRCAAFGSINCSSACPRSIHLAARALPSWLERSAGVAMPPSGRRLSSRSADFGQPLLGLVRRRIPQRGASRRHAADGRVIAGTVDRLLVEEQCISVIDFKTGRVPATDEDIPNAHRAQMQAYTEALRVIFPGRDVRAPCSTPSVQN